MSSNASTPFPIALCGKNPTLASHFVEMMDASSEFRVVTVFNTADQVAHELRSLLTGKPIHPLSGLGSNASTDEASIQAPKAIIVGAGFSDSEVDAVRTDLADLPAADPMAWFTPSPNNERMRGLKPGGPGFMEAVVGRAQDALRERRRGDGRVEAGVHGF